MARILDFICIYMGIFFLKCNSFVVVGANVLFGWT